MVQRTIAPLLGELFRRYPFVTVTGPRQSGKTTLCRTALPDLAYVNLESPNHRQFAEEDPKRFIATWPGGVILDEIQRVPSLLSWLQVFADDHGGNGLFVLTGSGQFLLSDRIDQSLAGRTALLRLLPFSLDELRSTGAATGVDDLLFTGFYPRIHAQQLDPTQALGDYVETYVERDVRRMLAVRNLDAFQRFVRLCAGRIGQLLNLASLGADAGVTHPTARHWLSVLEASYIVFRLPPYHGNLSKRLVKSPKLYFHDVGLASWLLGTRERPADPDASPARRPLREPVGRGGSEARLQSRAPARTQSFFRDSRGLECDLLYPAERRLLAVEAKSGATLASDWFAALGRVMPMLPNCDAAAVVHGDNDHQTRNAGEALPLTDLSRLLDRFDGGV